VTTSSPSASSSRRRWPRRVAGARDWEASEADLIDQAIAVPDDDSEFDR
jgi:hypothetical protein